MKKEKTGGRVRLTLDVPKGVKEGVDKFAEIIGATSGSEVLRRALSLLEFVLSGQRDGGKFILRHKDGSEETIRFL